MASSAQFTSKPRAQQAVISVANPNLDGTQGGTFATLFTPGTSGSRISRVGVVAIGVTQVGMIRLFIETTVNSVTTRGLLMEIPVTAISPTNSIPAWTGEVNFDYPFLLEPTQKLLATTSTGDDFSATTTGGDF
jgi:hypothetical protein